MNVILLEPHEIDGDGQARLEGRRAAHVHAVHRASVGDSLRVGVVDGKLGTATVVRADADAVTLDCTFTDEPPAAPDVTLVLALPRPLVLRRVLQHVTAFGCKRIVLLHAARVERSYWTSSALTPESLREQLMLGLEQARDTRLPDVQLRRRFRPFVEDELAACVGGGVAWVADPSASQRCPTDVTDPTTLFVGPEGGWVPFELELLAARGVRPVCLGTRILRVETAVAALLGRMVAS